MTPLAVFLRTFLRMSAIFAGASIVFLHPPLEWSTGSGAARAQKSPIEAAVDGLIVALNDKDEDVRCQAAWALGRAGKVRSVDALLGALKDSPAVRKQAIRALGYIGDPRALPALNAALEDDDPRVRRYAAKAIARITPRTKQ
jgi:HEAT repeat protein